MLVQRYLARGKNSLSSFPLQHWSLYRQKSVDQYPWWYKKGSISTRFVEKPNLPPGVAHKLADNYYVQRDPVNSIQKCNYTCTTHTLMYTQRREVAPPVVTGSQALLAEAHESVTR